MTIEGDFSAPQRQPLLNRVLVWALIVAVAAGAISLAALALAVALWLLPVAIGAGLVAYAVLRYRMWKDQRSLRGQGVVWRR